MEKEVKNDKLLIFETDKKSSLENEKISQLVKSFKEELRPIGVACKNWAKC